MEGEDLVSPVDQGGDDLVEFGEGMVLVGLDERFQRLVGFLRVLGEVDAVEVLEHPPGRLQVGVSGQDLAEGFDSFDVEAVKAAYLEVAGTEDFGIEDGTGTLGCDPLHTSTDLD